MNKYVLLFFLLLPFSSNVCASEGRVLEEDVPMVFPQLGESSEAVLVLDQSETEQPVLNPFFSNTLALKEDLKHYLHNLRNQQFDNDCLRMRLAGDVENLFGDEEKQRITHPSGLSFDEFVESVKLWVARGLWVGMSGAGDVIYHQYVFNETEPTSKMIAFKNRAIFEFVETPQQDISEQVLRVNAAVANSCLFYEAFFNALLRREERGLFSPYSPCLEGNEFSVAQTLDVEKLWLASVNMIKAFCKTYNYILSDIVVNLPWNTEVHGCDDCAQMRDAFFDYVFTDSFVEGNHDFGPRIPKLIDMTTRFNIETSDLVLTYAYLCGARPDDFKAFQGNPAELFLRAPSFLDVGLIGLAYRGNDNKKGVLIYAHPYNVYTSAKNLMRLMAGKLQMAKSQLKGEFNIYDDKMAAGCELLDYAPTTSFNNEQIQYLNEHYPQHASAFFTQLEALAYFKSVQFMIRDSLRPRFLGNNLEAELEEYNRYTVIYRQCLRAHLVVIQQLFPKNLH